MVYAHTGTHRKFLNPEVWFLQSVKMTDAPWPPGPDKMEYDFKDRPNKIQRRPRGLMYEIGHPVYRPKQPNGWPDTEPEWLSPELLIRRLAVAKRIAREFMAIGKLEGSIANNFDNAEEIVTYLKNCRNNPKLAKHFARHTVPVAK